MVRIQMTESRPGMNGYGPFKAGKRYALPGGLALQLVEADAAVLLSGDLPIPSPAADSPETATVEAPENAALRTTRPKGKQATAPED